MLLAHIVEHLSDTPYVACLRAQIFEPLGMESTGAGNAAAHPDRRANGDAGSAPVPRFELETVGIGAGDIWSTTADLARWDAALLAGRLFSAEARAAMFAAHADVPSEETDAAALHYGYGWFSTLVHGRRVQFHPGDNAGFAAYNALLPDADSPTIVVVLSNDERSDAHGLGRELVRAQVGG